MKVWYYGTVMKKKTYKIVTGIFTAVLAIFVLAAAFVAVVLYRSHENDFTAVQSKGKYDPRISVDIHPRGAIGDTWEKIAMEGTDQELMMKGMTYSAIIDSKMDTELSNWTMRIDIEQDVWLNNAWCGSFEIHQGDNTQILDLRSVNPDKIILEKLDDKDILIPLHKGDYIVYIPSEKEYETTIFPNGYKEIGFIIYTLQGVPALDFNKVSINCEVASEYDTKIAVRFLITIGVIWLISAVALVVFMIQMSNSEKAIEKEQALVEQTMRTISSFVDAKDEYTAGHSNRVASISKILAKRMGYKDEELRQVYYCGLLHDSGKVGIPDGILNKPGKLTEDEFQMIKTHSIIGCQMLERLSLVPMAATAARNHHERYDGAGYPDGLKGEEIPEVARILCVADAFDAMSTTRVYRKAMDREYIMGQFEIYRGTQFDPNIVDVFFKAVEDGEIVI